MRKSVTVFPFSGPGRLTGISTCLGSKSPEPVPFEIRRLCLGPIFSALGASNAVIRQPLFAHMQSIAIWLLAVSTVHAAHR